MRLTSIILGVAVLGLDLLTKWLVATSIWLHYYPVLDGYFTIHYVQNEGIAFGLFHSVESSWKPIILSAMAIVAVIVVVYYVLTTPIHEKLVFLSLGLLFGGILGNFFDRLLNRHVTDFLELHWRDTFAWPTFNIADAAITIGVLLILYESFFGHEPAPASDQKPLEGNALTDE
jgi:signal peptidase II